MALNMKDLVMLAKTVANADASSKVAYSYGEDKFNYSELNETLRKEINEIAGTYQLFRQNKNLVFQLLEETIDSVLPKKVLEAYGQFAEIKTVANGDKAVFTQKITSASRKRAKQFITKVGLAGRYEVFKLDGKSYEIKTEAFGGAAQIGFEDFLSGRVNFADLLDVVMEGLNEKVYLEIERALVAATSNLPTPNFHTGTSFVETQMDKLISIARAYGEPSIYCTYEFAATIIPQSGWISNEMKNQKWNVGYLGNYKGCRVIVLPQSYEDETNATKVIDPSYAWIIPTGADKPVKIVFEGSTAVRDVENEDWSREVQTYNKIGVGTMITNNICVYRNSSLTK